jgi:N-acetylglutamate synthase-like GNAT family acetyltransferase
VSTQQAWQVRRAGGGDAAAIAALYRELVPGDPEIVVEAARLDELAATTRDRLLVIEDGGVVVGTAALTVCLDAMYGRRCYGLVENVAVAAAARGGGVGRALLDEVARQAAAAGCYKLLLLSGAHRREAHGFFARVGFDGDKKRGFVRYL